MWSAKGGYCSTSLDLTPRTTLDLAWLKPDISLLGSNLMCTPLFIKKTSYCNNLDTHFLNIAESTQEKVV